MVVENNPAPNTIELKPRRTYSEFLPGFQDAINKNMPGITAPTLGAAPTINVPTLDKVQTIPGFDQSYWDSIYNQSKKKLSDEYFGDTNSLQTKMIENMNARGLLGSGVEQKGNQNLYKTFGSQLADMESNLTRTQAEQRLAEAQKVRDLQQARDIQSGEWGMQGALKSGDWKQARDIQGGQWQMDAAKTLGDWGMQGTELGLRSALTEAADQGKFDVGGFEQRIKFEDIKRQDELEKRKMALDAMTNPNYSMSDADREYWNKLLFGEGYLNQETAPEAKGR